MTSPRPSWTGSNASTPTSTPLSTSIRNRSSATPRAWTNTPPGNAAARPLHGVPFTIKDMTNVAGLPTTNGLRSQRDALAENDAVIVRRLREAGGLFLGKTNTPEFGYYGGTDNHLFGPTHNPWKHGHTAGGSSGGAAAAVASGLGPLAEGSDGAGSVRIPAAMCGVVGLKPTTGVIPHPVPFLDWAYHGPITRTVADNALMLDVVAGHSPATTPSAPRIVDSYREAMRGGIEGLRIAWSPDMGLGCHVAPDVLQVCHEVLEALESQGAHVVEASPRWSGTSVAMWHNIWVPMYSAQRSTLDIANNREHLDDNLVAVVEEGDQLRIADVGRAYTVRAAMWSEWNRFMADVDLLVSPTLASATFPLERFAPDWLEGTSVREQILDWLLTYPFNMLNNPAISVPAGFTEDGRPVGFQIAAKHWEDAAVLRAAAAVEEARPWAHHRPDLPPSP
ncbi:amidase [Spiractinospora alimapuensis]|uniref:amidase n=1 Tax=Spiractinospora alimapuensis TaxID=2820884 RepID=UPI0022AA86CA|nr:amidase [Spiractinospora alimapuensis]